MDDKRIYYKLSPELGDGSSSSIVDDKEVVLACIQSALEAFDGEEFDFSVETVWMTPEEVEALPDL